ncbi:MAG: lipopolysaccharide biosynthesis protein [Mediterranea sp.]|jgi:O-antigen/teichoic acid export membrane protein|nr:lipopolysaccharide biosynthesis protein [Mediterranea sp.]
MAEPTLKQKTAKGIFWGGISNGVQQLLGAFFGLFLARLLTPDDYGVIGMLVIFTQIAGTLQESGFTAALANKRNVTHADYNAVFWFSTGLSACLYLALFACAPLIAHFYGKPELTPLARYLFIGFFIASLGVAQNAYLFRNLMVKQKAIALMTGLVVSNTVGVIMALYGSAYWALATQTILYVAVISCCYWHFSPWRPTLSLDLKPLKGMLSFSSKLLLTNIFTQINNNILSVIFGKLYSSKDVGYYTQANKWNYMGYSLIAGMINSVAQPVLSSISDDGERQRRAFRKMLRFTAFAAFPSMLGLSFIAPEFITIALTDKWQTSAVILQLLCVAGAFIPLNNLFSNLLISKGKSNIYLGCTVTQGVLQILCALIGYPYGFLPMIAVYAAVNICWLFVWHYFVWRAIGLSLPAMLKDTLPFALVAVGAIAVAYGLTRSIENLYLLLLGKVAITAVVYTIIMWGSRAVTFRESLSYLRSALSGTKPTL